MTVLDRPMVLLAEDDAQIRALVAHVLRNAGYTVLTAADGAEALACVERLSSELDLLLADVVMPGMDGLAFAARVVTARPQTRILLMSGYSSVLGRVRASRLPFLAKPFTLPQLLEAVAAALRTGGAAERTTAQSA